MDADKTARAIFIQQLTLAVSQQGNGTTDPTGSQLFDAGTTASVTATPAQGWTFSHWMLDGVVSGSNSPLSVTMTQNRTVVAVFIQAAVLNMQVVGTGTVSPVAGLHTYSLNTVVNLSATPASGWIFSRWEGNVASSTSRNTTITMDMNQNVSAVFIKRYTLTMSDDGNGTTTPGFGNQIYDAGTVVTVTATPSSGFTFDYWVGDVADVNANPTTVTMDGNRLAEAHFKVAVVEGEPVEGQPLEGAPLEGTLPEGETEVPPTAGFAAQPTSGTAPLSVVFTDQSVAGSSAITRWAWSFGDTATSQTQNPTHVYTQAGTYTVTLTVTTALGSDAERKTAFITVTAPAEGEPVEGSPVEGQPVEGQVDTPPVANFTADPTTGVTPLSVKFTDSSVAGSSAITRWSWSFGDGTTSAQQSPTHVYTTPGRYGVTLTVTTAIGSDSERKMGFIEVLELPEGQPLEGSPLEGETLEGQPFEGDIPGPFAISGHVINALTDAPVKGAYVEISADVTKAIVGGYTNAEGMFSFNVDHRDMYYMLTVTCREYTTVTQTRVIAPLVNTTIELSPVAIAKPRTPIARSAAKSVYVEWEANPEYNLKGYYVWRTLSGGEAAIVSDLIQVTEFKDETTTKGAEYTYQIQAISGADRPSDLSDASESVKAEFLTVYFPDIDLAKDIAGFNNMELNQGEWWVRIPVTTRCAYEIFTSGMGIAAKLPDKQLEVSSLAGAVKVLPTGVTAGMKFTSSVTTAGQLKINAAIGEGRSLYGAGVLFDVLLKAKNIYETCDATPNMTFVANTTRFYDDSYPSPLRINDIVLEDGVFCGGGSCIQGDVDNNGLVDLADAEFINQYWVESVEPTACTLASGDLNRDGYVDAADAVMILRHVEGLDVNPSTDAKAVEPVAPQVKLGLIMGAPGETVSVPLTVTTEDSLLVAGFSVLVAYAKGDDAANCTGVALGEALEMSGYTISTEFSEDNGHGAVRISVAGAQPIGSTGEFTLANLSFQIGANAAVGKVVPAAINSVTFTNEYGFTPKFTAPGRPSIVIETPPAEGEPVEGQVEGEILEGAPLEGSLEGEVLEGAPLEGEILEGAPLEGSLEGEVLEGEQLEGQPLEGAPLEGEVLEGQSEGQPVEGAPLEGEVLEGEAEGQVQEGEVPQLIVNFSVDKTTGPAPLTVTFSDETVSNDGDILEWNWTFGDGQSSTLQNPVHEYTSPGTFSVGLTVRTANASQTRDKLDLVLVTAPAVEGESTEGEAVEGQTLEGQQREGESVDGEPVGGDGQSAEGDTDTPGTSSSGCFGN
jgi:PKD repeat protein